MEAQEVESVGSLPQIHDSSLVRADPEFEGLRRLLQPPQGLLGIGLRSTEDDGIIRVANDGAEVTGLLGPEGVGSVWPAAVRAAPPASARPVTPPRRPGSRRRCRRRPGCVAPVPRRLATRLVERFGPAGREISAHRSASRPRIARAEVHGRSRRGSWLAPCPSPSLTGLGFDAAGFNFLAACSFVPPFGSASQRSPETSLPGSSGGLPGPHFHRLVASPCLAVVQSPRS
jgi:hypothetical protein